MLETRTEKKVGNKMDTGVVRWLIGRRAKSEKPGISPVMPYSRRQHSCFPGRPTWFTVNSKL